VKVGEANFTASVVLKLYSQRTEKRERKACLFATPLRQHLLACLNGKPRRHFLVSRQKSCALHSLFSVR